VNRRAAAPAILVLIGLVILSGIGALAQDVAGTELRVMRTISAAYALPGSRFVVTLHVYAEQNLNGVGIDETLPLLWTVQPLDNAGAAFKRGSAQWVFPEPMKAGSSKVIVYEVTVPNGDRLLNGSVPACYSITGMAQAKAPALLLPVEGDSELQVVTELPIVNAITHLAVDASGSDVIDLRLSQWITPEQFSRSLNIWQTSAIVPQTGGEIIDLETMKRIIAHVETCTPADAPLPQAPQLIPLAVRSINTSLPCDSILLDDGVPSLRKETRQYAVAVDVTAQHDTYGVGLKEDVPTGWRITPIDNGGFLYRAGTGEWVYPEKLAAGTTRRILYLVDVMNAPIDDMANENWCCGTSVALSGEVDSAVPCGASPVFGESTVQLWRALPVILAISRWDAELDTLDVTLSNRITFNQMQRATAFWLDAAIVPYTGGYTVGYETLKAIMTYWMTNTPVTQPLPGLPADPCDVEGLDCTEGQIPCTWFCEMMAEQPLEDRIGLSP